MSSDHREELAGFVLIFLLGIAGLFVLVYAISASWIYFWFYAVPFILGSAIVGGVLKLFTSVWVESDFSEKSSKHYLVYNYKALAVIFPVFIFIILAVFYFDPTAKVIEEKTKGKETIRTVVLEWPGLNKFFNDSKRSWYVDSTFTSLRRLSNEPEIYDRRNLGNTLWVSLFLGGPLFFFWLARKDEFIEGEAMIDGIQKKVKAERDRLNDLILNKEKYIESTTATADKRNAELRDQRDALERENLVLKAKVEFIAPVLLPKGQGKEETSTGLLDKDIL